MYCTTYTAVLYRGAAGPPKEDAKTEIEVWTVEVTDWSKVCTTDQLCQLVEESLRLVRSGSRWAAAEKVLDISR